jgi:hypothetical protein
MISKLVEAKKGKMVYTLKHNGHPVAHKGKWFIDEEKLYPKVACDVRYQYSTISPPSAANQSLVLWARILYLERDYRQPDYQGVNFIRRCNHFLFQRTTT